MLDFGRLFSFHLDDILAAWSHLEKNVANGAFYPIERGGAPAGLRGRNLAFCLVDVFPAGPRAAHTWPSCYFHLLRFSSARWPLLGGRIGTCLMTYRQGRALRRMLYLEAQNYSAFRGRGRLGSSVYEASDS